MVVKATCSLWKHVLHGEQQNARGLLGELERSRGVYQYARLCIAGFAAQIKYRITPTKPLACLLHAL
jgi:hypothetical protein